MVRVVNSTIAVRSNDEGRYVVEIEIPLTA